MRWPKWWSRAQDQYGTAPGIHACGIRSGGQDIHYLERRLPGRATPQIALTLNLDGLDAERVEELLRIRRAAVSYTDQRDDPILELAPGEFRLLHSRLQALFPSPADRRKSSPDLHMYCASSRSSSSLKRWDKVWSAMACDFILASAAACGWRRNHSHAHTTGAIIVRLDPGLAFGTGTHATTAMCPPADEHANEGQVVIDYGCGSGVLAVAASKLGARAAYAYDIDPQALTATRDNSVANDVDAQVHVVERDADLPKGADILLANILCGPLCDLAPRFAELTVPGGKIVLAGLLATQADEVTRAHAPWFDISPFATRDGWTALTGTRRR
jgi:ribosomal protein L11 methyltransferase